MKTALASSHPWVRRGLGLLLFLIPLALLAWSLRQVALGQVWQVLGGLDARALWRWLLVNLGIVLLMSGRWWLILRTLRQPVFFPALVGYRLAAFAVSYFTPGPQFGGEPLQVYLLSRRQQVAPATATAGVALDKLLELIANFSFLVFGLVWALTGAWLPGAAASPSANSLLSLGLALGLLGLPLAYLVGMLAGKQPFNRLFNHWLPARLANPALTGIPPQRSAPRRVEQAWLSGLLQVERQMAQFCVAHPGAVLLASFISLLIWGGMLTEYWMATGLLGLDLQMPEVVSALVAARLAFLTPLPAGAGALEAGQVLALQALGLPAAYGLSLSLLIRGRDLLIGISGACLALVFLGRDWLAGAFKPGGA